MKIALRVVAMTAALLAPLASHAHKTWLLPSATVSTVDQWVTIDAAVSNDLFYFNHVPLRLDSLMITAPDGSKIAPENSHTGKYNLVVEATREVGGRELLRLPFEWPGTQKQQASANGKTELGAVTLNVTP